MNVLEVGSWAGGSAITWAEGIKKYLYGKGSVLRVDPWIPFFNPQELRGSASDRRDVYNVMHDALQDDQIYALFLHNVKAAHVADIVYPFRGPSDKVLPLLAPQAYNIVFIDGDHRYHAISKDIQNAKQLVAPNGILCGDDLELQLSQVDVPFAKNHAEKDFVCDPRTGQHYHPGVTLAVGELLSDHVTAYEGFWAVRNREHGWAPVVLPPALNTEIPRHLMGSAVMIAIDLVEYLKKMGC